jgi:hypothetical protein
VRVLPDAALTTLDARRLGRSVLARQLLAEREELPVAAAVERLFGLNAQDPNLPYLALWTRLRSFAVRDLTAAIEDGVLVRSTLLRATQHLMTAADFALVRPLLAPLLQRVQRNAFGARTAGVDLDALVAEARDLLAGGRVLTRPELGRALAASWPGVEPSALGWTVQYLLPVVHPAPSGTWDVRGATPFALASGAPSPSDVRVLVRRYLAAFGPASVPDARAWSGLGGLREVFEGMRGELRVFRDESGRELFDVPDGRLPDGDVPVPVRFLPDFDAVVLAHADRTRVMTEQVRRRVCVGAAVAATVLVDGTVAATWTASRSRDATVVTVTPLRPLASAERSEAEAEGLRLATFLKPDAQVHDVRLLDRDG